MSSIDDRLVRMERNLEWLMKVVCTNYTTYNTFKQIYFVYIRDGPPPHVYYHVLFYFVPFLSCILVSKDI